MEEQRRGKGEGGTADLHADQRGDKHEEEQQQEEVEHLGQRTAKARDDAVDALERADQPEEAKHALHAQDAQEGDAVDVATPVGDTGGQVRQGEQHDRAVLQDEIQTCDALYHGKAS